MKPLAWDYDLPKNWQPATDAEWEWYLARKINYDDLTGITGATLARYFPKIAQRLDPGKRLLIEYFLKNERGH